eukprot:4230164-Ditylum_brightwellii.AAC.1
MYNQLIKVLPEILINKLEDDIVGLQNVYEKQNKDCQAFFADAGNPIADMQMIIHGQIHVAETGLFKKEYLEW